MQPTPPRPAATHVSFLRYRRARWFKLALLLVVLCIVLYAWHQPLLTPNGGTWLGYTLGTIGALLIVWLTWFGVRKRRYRRASAVQGWLSAHVYLGLSLIVVATLHTGFQFGWNVHTLAYGLMMAVIASGTYGIIAYVRYPEEITRLRSGETRETWLAQIVDLNEQAIKLADPLGAEVHRVVTRSNERALRGIGLLAPLWKRKTAGINEITQLLAPTLRTEPDPNRTLDRPANATTLFMASRIIRAQGDASNAEKARQLLETLTRRNAVVERLNEDLRLHAYMKAWLHLHIPLTLALLAALVAHIVSVFIYW